MHSLLNALTTLIWGIAWKINSSLSSSLIFDTTWKIVLSLLTALIFKTTWKINTWITMFIKTTSKIEFTILVDYTQNCFNIDYVDMGQSIQEWTKAVFYKFYLVRSWILCPISKSINDNTFLTDYVNFQDYLENSCH